MVCGMVGFGSSISSNEAAPVSYGVYRCFDLRIGAAPDAVYVDGIL